MRTLSCLLQLTNKLRPNLAGTPGSASSWGEGLRGLLIYHWMVQVDNMDKVDYDESWQFNLVFNMPKKDMFSHYSFLFAVSHKRLLDHLDQKCNNPTETFETTKLSLS